ncbi:hypothetical protein [Lactococcus lactis]|uniref:hypothetical protein n=1 Tax=Lactococcus lactis TaxID=1358 RepID=UPI0011BB6D8C|nr:hypothetical protein [Lactococcus lactis]QEA60961.1 hypothetical protein FGL73_05420 [Lactococcus lactis]
MSDKKCPNCGYELDSWNDCVSVNNILECPECEEHFELKAVTLNELQLTIPKSIADELDRVEMNWNTLKDEAQGWPTDDLIMWLDAGNNPLMFAYLAGKALGVDLVKVVADDSNF